MEYRKAKKLADRVVEIFSPHCDRIHIAGSIRRLRPAVKDIEIICTPKKKFIQEDLFGNGYHIIVPGFEEAVAMVTKETVKGKTDGRYMQVILKGGATLDIFMPQQHDYYRMYAIRTGSKDYSEKVLAASWKKMGWCGTSLGLRRQSDCFEKKGIWTVCNPNGQQPPVWESEEHFFTWLQVSFLKPEFREV
jgi:DNA polymerase/3'-5' exonuclease PolX